MLDWTQILSVINLQRQRGTAPQSRVSSRQHVSPGENTVYTCVCVCVCATVYCHLCKYPQQTALYYPTASVPAGQPTVICSAEGYECWHFTDMTCRSFRNYRNPQSPRRWWWASKSNAGLFLVSPLLRGESPLINLEDYFADAADEFVDGGVKSK